MTLDNGLCYPEPAPVEIAMVSKGCTGPAQHGQQLVDSAIWLAVDADQRLASGTQQGGCLSEDGGVLADVYDCACVDVEPTETELAKR